MTILNENWKETLAQLLDRDVDQVEAVIKKKDFTFSDFLEVGKAVEEEDIETLVDIFKSADDLEEDLFGEYENLELDDDIEESDNPYAGVQQPTQPTQPQTAASGPQQVTTKEPDNLLPGDRVTVRDISGNEVETSIKSRGPGQTYVVTGKDGDSVVKQDNIVATPTLKEFASTSQEDSSVVRPEDFDSETTQGLQVLRNTLHTLLRQDPPALTKNAMAEIYNGHPLPPRLSVAISPYIEMLDAIISDPTLRYRFVNLVKLSDVKDEDEDKADDSDIIDDPDTVAVGDIIDDPDVTDDPKKVKTETTTAGAIASAPVSVGKPIRRKPNKNETYNRTKKK